MTQLDREGIFKARLLEWNVKPSEKSQAVAISIEFHILDQLDGNDWISWERYEDHSVWGDFYVVKSDGQINTGPVEQLAQSIGWNGDFSAVNSDPPDTVVQITVKEDEYDGKIRYRAQWINPGDFTPRPAAATAEKVTELNSRYGSLLRAAAGAAKENRPGPATDPLPTSEKPPPPTDNDFDPDSMP